MISTHIFISFRMGLMFEIISSILFSWFFFSLNATIHLTLSSSKIPIYPCFRQYLISAFKLWYCLPSHIYDHNLFSVGHYNLHLELPRCIFQQGFLRKFVWLGFIWLINKLDDSQCWSQSPLSISRKKNRFYPLDLFIVFDIISASFYEIWQALTNNISSFVWLYTG